MECIRGKDEYTNFYGLRCSDGTNGSLSTQSGLPVIYIVFIISDPPTVHV